jgi:hypothetical protein
VVVLASSAAAPGAGGCRISSMPSLFRFLIFVGLLGALAYGTVFSLATFVQYKQREIVVTIPPDKFLKQPH